MEEIKMPSYEEGPFEDVRDTKKFQEQLFTMCTGSFANLIRKWAIEHGKDLKDQDKSLLRIYHRANAVVRYANHIVGQDTDDYKGDPRDLQFHKDLISITEEIEKDWEEKYNDPAWKKDMLSKVDARTHKYMEDKRPTSPGNQN